MKILITGGHGLVGYSLAEKILNDGVHELVISSRGAPKIAFKQPHTYVDMDINDHVKVEKVLNDIKPDCLINSAALSQADFCEQNPDLCFLTNTKSAVHLAACAKRLHAFFIQLSTDFVFDGSSGPYVEQDPTEPVNIYGRSKLDAELGIKCIYEESAIVRTVLVYGYVPTLSRSNLILWVKKSLEERKPIKVVSDQFRTPTHVNDLCSGLVSIAEMKAKGTWHLSGKDFLSPFQIAEMCADVFGLDKSLITPVSTRDLNEKARRPLKTGFIIEKAEKELNYRPVSMLAGIHAVKKAMTDIETSNQ